MVNHEQRVEIGNRIRERRLEAGLSKVGLSRATGIPRRSIWQIELGERNIDIYEFQAIAKALKCSFTYLLTGHP